MWLAAMPKFELTLQELALLSLITSYYQKTGLCFASKETMADILNVSEGTIYNWLRKLLKKGLVEKRGAPKNCLTACLKLSDEWIAFDNDMREEHKMIKWDSRSDLPQFLRYINKGVE